MTVCEGNDPIKPIRVYMVVRLFYPWIGGAERQAHKLAKTLTDKGVEVELVTGWWFRSTPQHDEIDGIPIYRNLTLWAFFGIKGLRKFGGYLYILSLMFHLWRRRADYDLVHVHGLNYHTFAAVLINRFLNRPTVTKLANSGQASDIIKMRKEKQLALARYMLPTALKSDRFVALNKTVVTELAAAGVPSDRITRLPNGVEIDELFTKTDYALQDPARLLFVGRLHEQKGLDVLLEAVSQVLQHAPDMGIRLQLLGDGPLHEELRSLADSLGISAHVEFLGQRETVTEYLKQADIFVLPSRAEGISNALLEAMACGLPAVVSKIPGNVDVVEQGKNGLVFTVDDPESLADSLLLLLTQEKLRAELGRAARRTVEAGYSLDYVADQYINIYRELLSVEKNVTSPCQAICPETVVK